MDNIQERLLNLAAQHDLSSLSLRQIARMAGVEHAQTVKYHLGKLVASGKITNIGGAIKVVSRGTEDGLLSIPILGSANCGAATRFADERVEGFLRISPRLVSPARDVFAVRAIGNSMDKADIGGQPIEDGDYVLIRPYSNQPKNGDYVLSVIGDTANIKRFVSDAESNMIALYSESTEAELHPPILIHPEDDYRINGRVVQVVKMPKGEKK